MNFKNFKTGLIWQVLHRRHYLCAVLCATVALWGAACGTSGEEIRQKQIAAMDESSPAEILYQSILDEMRTREWSVATSSERMLFVAGEYEPLGGELRRRVVSQVMVFPNGVALNVLAEYQRMDRTTVPPTWVEATEPTVVQRARREEAEFGAAVQARFAKTR